MKIISSSTIFCVGLFFLSTCIKILLFPAYRSTDFDVHRNWLAITKNLPVSQWYFDDVNGTTVHTLDYPPSFAFFEYFWSSNPITKKIFQYYYHRVHGSDSAENERCLELLPDSDNSPSVFCVYFQRSTVILSDFIFLIGAIFASYSLFYTVISHRQEQDTSSKGLSTQQQQQFNKFNSQQTRSFSIATLLIVFNPGIMILDHVHFQYNGMLLGFLLISMGFLNLGMSSSSILQTADNEKRKIKWDILGAIFFAVLITMKHLYMTLAPLYFVYLLRHCCFTPTSRNTLNSNNSKIGKTRELSFSMKAFCKLSIVTATCLITPFLPFCLSSSTYSIQSQLIQILKRLFPFARGLCHDYWAANVWALYLFFQKILLFISTKLLRNDSFTEVLLKLLPVDSEIPPSATAILLLLSLMPALILTWTRSEPFKITHNSSFNEKVLEKRSFFILAVVYCSFCSFMLSYHVHEKAIMTVIIPLTLLATVSKANARLYVRTATLGHFGLLPLLYRPIELLFKVTVIVCHMSLSLFLLEYHFDLEEKESRTKSTKMDLDILTIWDKIFGCILLLILIFAEIIHPLFIGSSMEFLPLMMISVTCATGLVICWVHSGILLLSCCRAQKDVKRD